MSTGAVRSVPPCGRDDRPDPMQPDDQSAWPAEARQARRRPFARRDARRAAARQTTRRTKTRVARRQSRLTQRKQFVRRRRPDRLRVEVSDESGRALRAGGLARWLERVAPPAASGAVSLAIVRDEVVRALNRQYRGRAYATDVLSFPAFAPPADRRASARQGSNPKFLIPDHAFDFLGDIVIARGVARRQASEANHSQETELRVLALHGLLHLLGYDHETDAGEMAALESRLRRKGGLSHGLTERTGAERRRS